MSRTTHLAIVAGAIQVGFVCFLLLSSSVLFALGVPVSWVHVPLATVLAGGFGWWVVVNYFAQGRVTAFAVAFGGSAMAFILFALIESALYDVSWDGQAYHAEAIEQLANGWNPFRGALPAGLAWPIYLKFWSKGPWVCAAALYRLTGSFEAGKAFHLMLMLSSWLFAWAAFTEFPGITRRWALIGSVLMAMNPVSLSQIHTFYVDGLLASLLATAISVMILIGRRPDRMLMAVLASVIVVTINVKLNGAIYIGILAGGYWLWYAIHQRRRRAELGAALLAGGIGGGAFVGFNPYMTEFVRRLSTDGHRFLLSDWMSLLSIARESPENFSGMNRVEKWLVALFSRSDVLPGLGPTQLKMPFAFSGAEIHAFAAPDVRAGGFGPLFGGAMLLAAVLLVLLVVRYRSALLTNSPFVLTALTAVSILPNQEMWWARLAPQSWLLPVLLLLAGHRLIRDRTRWLLVALSATLSLNVAIQYIPNALAAYAAHREVASQLSALKDQPTPVMVQFNRFAATRYRFEREGIDYAETATLPCTVNEQVRVRWSEAVLCLR